MNRNEARWRHCYWKEWLLIKKRRDELHATRPKGADDGASQNKVRLSLHCDPLGRLKHAEGLEMVKKTLFALVSAVCISVFAQAAQEGDVVAPATPHQEQTVERMEALEGNAPQQEPKSVQEAAGHPALASPHQAEVLEEIAMRFRNLDQDQDGQVSPDEAKAEVDLAKRWAALDDNGDGKLNVTEYAKRTIPSHQTQ